MRRCAERITQRWRCAMTERAKYWQPIVADWAASGLSQAEFCRQRDINVVNFRWWKQQLTAKQQSNSNGHSSTQRRRSTSNKSSRYHKGTCKRARRSTNSFVEVKMTDFVSPTGYEVVLSGGRVLRLGRVFDAEAVTRLISAVEAAC